MPFAAVADGPALLSPRNFAGLTDDSARVFGGSYSAMLDGLAQSFSGPFAPLSDDVLGSPLTYAALADEPAQILPPLPYIRGAAVDGDLEAAHFRDDASIVRPYARDRQIAGASIAL